MLNNMKNLLGQKGSMMVEALAMLGLISMVTPMLYKKAAERTTELADINAASAARTLSAATETYLAANKSKLDAFGGWNNDKFVLDVEDGIDPLPPFTDYLPDGYMASSGRIFEGYDIAIKRKAGDDGKYAYTGMVAIPTVLDPDADKIRLAKIASMIGGNGGLVEKEDGKAIGVQGLWEADSSNFFGNKLEKGTIVAATVTAVGAGGSGGGIGVDEKALYRIGDEREKNTMQTDLYMGGAGAEGMHYEIRDVTSLVAASEEIISITQEGGDGTGDLLSVAGNVSMNNLVANGVANIADSLTVGDKVYFSDDSMNVGSSVVQFTDNQRLTASVGEDISLEARENVNITGQAMVKLLNNDNEILMDSSEGAPSINIKSGEQKIDLQDNKIDFTSNVGHMVTFNNDGINIVNNDEGGGLLNAGGILIVSKNDSGELYDGAIYNGDIVRVSDSAAFSMYNRFAVSDDYVAALVPSNFYNNVTMRGDVIMSADGTKNGTISEHDLYAHVKNITLKARDSFNWESENDVTVKEGGKIVLSAATDTTEQGPSIVINPENNGDVNINGESDINLKSSNDINMDSASVKMDVSNSYVVKNGEDTVLFVDTDSNTENNNKESVYIRKGAIEVASTRETTGALTPAGNYIMADRLVSAVGETNNSDLSNLYNTLYGSAGTNKPSNPYDAYQVNPAYTSVMHDIKLTTRGGARLSDILPDFISKGIYVLDNSYVEKNNRNEEADWNEDIATTSGSSDSYLTLESGTVKTNTNVIVNASSSTEITSPWLGFIPAPQCPPGYGKVVTMNPIRWRMSEIYRVSELGDDEAATKTTITNSYTSGGGGFGWLEESHYPARFPKEVDLSEVKGTLGADGKTVSFDGQQINIVGGDMNATPPTFQTNTWLNTTVASAKTSDTFYGWHAIMGFLYNLAEYKAYLEAAGGATINVDDNGSTISSSKFAWNVFPVRPSELMAIGHTYCYFDKRNEWKNNLVDNDTPVFDGDNVSNIRTGLDKTNTGYTGRLNDTELHYNDPW